MSDTKWVQHRSGQGEKWEVSGYMGKSTEWSVKDRNGTGFHYLPKSEFIPCAGEWEDVTGDVIPSECEGNWSLSGRDVIGIDTTAPIRFRKVRCGKSAGVNNPDWAFIVERKK